VYVWADMDGKSLEDFAPDVDGLKSKIGDVLVGYFHGMHKRIFAMAFDVMCWRFCTDEMCKILKRRKTVVQYMYKPNGSKGFRIHIRSNVYGFRRILLSQKNDEWSKALKIRLKMLIINELLGGCFFTGCRSFCNDISPSPLA
jgi:hypothetical protein